MSNLKITHDAAPKIYFLCLSILKKIWIMRFLMTNRLFAAAIRNSFSENRHLLKIKTFAACSDLLFIVSILFNTINMNKFLISALNLELLLVILSSRLLS